MTANCCLELAIVIDNASARKIAGALNRLIGSGFGALAGSLETRSSVVTHTMLDICSGVQIAIAEGNSTATNYGAAMGAFGGGGAAGLSGFSRTPEGQATVAAFVDAHNSMGISLGSHAEQEMKSGLGKSGLLQVGS